MTRLPRGRVEEFIMDGRVSGTGPLRKRSERVPESF
jgi:hypothetical protein